MAIFPCVAIACIKMRQTGLFGQIPEHTHRPKDTQQLGLMGANSTLNENVLAWSKSVLFCGKRFLNNHTLLLLNISHLRVAQKSTSNW